MKWVSQGPFYPIFTPQSKAAIQRQDEAPSARFDDGWRWDVNSHAICCYKIDAENKWTLAEGMMRGEWRDEQKDISSIAPFSGDSIEDDKKEHLQKKEGERV